MPRWGRAAASSTPEGLLAPASAAAAASAATPLPPNWRPSDSPAEVLQALAPSEEQVPGLAAFLHELGLSDHTAPAARWACEQGICCLEEMLENQGEFAEILGLKLFELERLLQGGRAATTLVLQTEVHPLLAATEKPKKPADHQRNGEQPVRTSRFRREVKKAGASNTFDCSSDWEWPNKLDENREVLGHSEDACAADWIVRAEYDEDPDDRDLDEAGRESREHEEVALHLQGRGERLRRIR